ncbi:PepN Aminopeptidase N [Rhabdaerophilaceae bacterium]
MTAENSPMIRLADYRPPNFLIDHVDLDFALHPSETMVNAVLHLRRNPDGVPDAPLVLDGEDLILWEISLNETALFADRYTVGGGKLTIPVVPDMPFKVIVKTQINPAANTRLMGLYRSNGIYCTQCEADAFRRITYFLDRPDVMSTYSVRIEAEKAEAPLLLSNGNPVASGDIPGSTRHFARWEDPHRKPAYLFALVAGDLDWITDYHTTSAGRRVALNIYVERGKGSRAGYAMDSLIRSMKWDEEKFGRDYDLDLFNIVAVSDFNMGAMENKGLNIFNDRYILASSDTATDQDYHNIEAIVAHEYFHNWTGNRITCRDWFQLCLKEGLTVFRDQEFSSDERSRAVERIANVQTLRASQFVEDAGPLAHPVRPQQYKEINNFYTATVYNKGSEVIQMLRLIIGAEKFREGMNLYFGRHDGQACTVEQFIACFAEVTGRDFSQFMRWYDQAGTPMLTIRDSFDPKTGRYTLTFSQETKPTPGQPDKLPQVIPVKLGLLDERGNSLLDNDVVLVDADSVTKIYESMPSRPIPSLLRGFSAPVRLDLVRSPGDLLTLAAHDPDPFNRWQALQDVEIALLKRSVNAIRIGQPPETDATLAEAVRQLIVHSGTDRAFAALAIALPRENDMAREIGTDVDPNAIGVAVSALWKAIGAHVSVDASITYSEISRPSAFRPDATSAGKRALALRLLNYLVAGAPKDGARLAFAQFERADNMTDRANALWALVMSDEPERDEALAMAEARFLEDPLLLDLWFTLNASIPGSEGLKRAENLMSHPKFTLLNPNRVRALIGAFAHGNARGFHMADGSGYRLLAGLIGEIDGKNPQLAARLATAFRTWRGLEPHRRNAAQAELSKLFSRTALSRDLADILERSLSDA